MAPWLPEYVALPFGFFGEIMYRYGIICIIFEIRELPMHKTIAFIKHEALETIPATAFFFIAFNLLILTKAMVVKRYGIPYFDISLALVGALLVAKVVLIMDKVPFINKFPDKPLIYNIVWKTCGYVLCALLVRYLEHLIPLAFKYSSLAQANAHIMDDINWPYFLIVQLWLSVLLFVFSSLRELVRVVGREKAARMFFGWGPEETSEK